MALQNCSECGNEVSSKAATCPKCGNPITNAAQIHATDKPVITTQATSKKFKGQQLLAAVLCCLGLIIQMVGGADTYWGAIVLLVGLVWFIVARVGAWWHHG
jgi:uncharacterized membrane protein YvbJ